MSALKRPLIMILAFGVFMWVFSQAHTPDQQNAVILGSLALFGYLLPWLIALNRGHHNAAAIGMLTILLGWTFIGWAIAMIWACTAVKEPNARLMSA